ncbi:unnamed protein product [Pseudo-nitzschia multistriata]|uniref:Amine oxidase n=1 Tax=Pseudo-nitzschia multistriata TaxID=183589 RepID=A0A448Z0V2_9STRA|nr:unnamed protein product [Pseudo-nitzschia multistriata]
MKLSALPLLGLLARSPAATAFLPSRPAPRATATALSESILEAEDRFLAQAMEAPLSPRDLPEVVYTIVYNPGTPEEGVHTMKHPRGSDGELLLCFEGMADCVLFARTIKEDPALDQEPIPTPTSREMIQGAAEGMGMRMEIVPMDIQTQW